MLYCFFVLMACQPRVCMRMRNTKYCIVEVASKRASKRASLRFSLRREDILDPFIRKQNSVA